MPPRCCKLFITCAGCGFHRSNRDVLCHPHRLICDRIAALQARSLPRRIACPRHHSVHVHVVMLLVSDTKAHLGFHLYVLPECCRVQELFSQTQAVAYCFPKAACSLCS